MFEDPVVGPQLALGLLSMGTGLLTSGPEGANRAIQGGLGHISQGLYYGGRQQAKKTEKEEKAAARAALAEKMNMILGGAPSSWQNGTAAPVSMPGAAPLSSPYVQAPRAMAAPVAAQAGPNGSPMGEDPRVAQLMALQIQNPESADVFAPAIKQLTTPRKKSRTEELIDLYMHPEGSPQHRAGAYGLGFEMSPEEREEFNATQKYKNESLYISRRNSDLTASSQALTAANQRATDADRDRAYQLSVQSQENLEKNRAAKIAQGGTPVYDAEGNITSFIGGPGPKLNVEQGKATALGMRGVEASEQLDEIEDKGYGPGVGTQIQQAAGKATGAVDRFLAPQAQMYNQASTNFLTAVLRKESGAQITESEWATGNRQYFAQPGDSDEVKGQKRQNRKTAMDAMAVQSGPGQPAVEARRTAAQGAGAGLPGSLQMETGAPTKEQIEEEMRKRGLL